MSISRQIKPVIKKLDAFLESKTEKFKPLHKLAIFSAVLILPVILFVLLVFLPAQEEKSRIKEQIAQEKINLSSLRDVDSRLDQLKEEMAEVESGLELARLMLPEQREIPGLLTDISNTGTASGLDFILFRPQNERRKEFYAEIPVEIAVRGPYHSVGDFLDRISRLPRIVTVNNLNMGTPVKSEGTMFLNTSFTLLTYRFIEGEPEEKP